jgi:hypothetical protein
VKGDPEIILQFSVFLIPSSAGMEFCLRTGFDLTLFQGPYVHIYAGTLLSSITAYSFSSFFSLHIYIYIYGQAKQAIDI